MLNLNEAITKEHLLDHRDELIVLLNDEEPASKVDLRGVGTRMERRLMYLTASLVRPSRWIRLSASK